MADIHVTPDKLLDAFPYPTLTKIRGEPNRKNLTIIFDELKANASDIITNLGGGNHGHLGLLYDPAEYLALAGVAYTPPAQPGVQALVAANASGAIIQNQNATYARRVKAWNNYVVVKTVLKNQLINCVEAKWIRALRNRHTQFANVTILQLLNHLFDNYGKVEGTDFKTNLDNIQKDWDPEEPFVVIIDQIEDACDVAEEGHMPFSDAMTLQFAENIVDRTNLYFQEMVRWKALPAAQRTWPLFQVYMTQAQKALKEQQRCSSRAAGYHSANAIQQAQQESYAQAAEALAKLAVATDTDRTLMCNLTTTVSSMATQLKEATDLITNLKQQLANKKTPKVAKVLYYCWSHGYTTNPKHDSGCCNNPKEGHKKEATIANNMGGSQNRKPST